jgi:flagellar biosynthetic protein FliR
MLMIVKEALIGLALGFVMQIVMHVFILAGQFISLKIGLGFAAQNDPSSGVSVTVISQFYLLLSTLLFLAIDGHLALIQMLINSFVAFPVSGGGLTSAHFKLIVDLFSWMFASALLITLPLLTSMMIVNLSFGVMGRSAPQMNILSVGFSITLMFGFLLMWYSLSNFLPLFNQVIQEGMTAAATLVESR